MGQISEFSTPRVRRELPPGPVEATVVTGPDDSLDFVTIQLDKTSRALHGPFPWVSNGRLPQTGDGCLLLHGDGEVWALVRATGELITE